MRVEIKTHGILDNLYLSQNTLMLIPNKEYALVKYFHQDHICGKITDVRFVDGDLLIGELTEHSSLVEKYIEAKAMEISIAYKEIEPLFVPEYGFCRKYELVGLGLITTK